ncbi:hypothetical protein CAPTEDRAFT_186322 [Capitella teleta]|uniref:TNFR-Cys domain-containing protein n=1 Tax=Capitella teleta TaxID=283909 RepID=R7TPG1_CAPTE|nr:hypothetical protein CAPTEDRAFT_186322 [Capitella teleta]|eukprot:ELT93391.1 hypothetical protein CAPTEDRAFT_186322 [Capitella teleta]
MAGSQLQTCCWILLVLFTLTTQEQLTDWDREGLSNNSTYEVDCTECSPGYGVVELCTAIQDTVCKECPAGTFNSRFSLDHPCSPCRTCGEWYYERIPCTASQDVTCEPCFVEKDLNVGGGGFGNEDFLKKCEGGEPPPAGVVLTKPPPLIFIPQIPMESSEKLPEPIPTLPPEKKITPHNQKIILNPVPPAFRTVKPGGEPPTPSENVTEGLVEIEGVAVTTGSTQWPMFVAILIGLLALVIVGALVTYHVFRKKEREKGMLIGTKCQSLMRMCRGPGLAMRRKPFYNSQELKYIDEDSDDEIVQHCGRPPSIIYKDPSKVKRKSSLLRMLKPNSNRGSSSGLRRSESAEKKIFECGKFCRTKIGIQNVRFTQIQALLIIVKKKK